MLPPDPLFVFTRKLDELGIAYMITGGVAAIFYGEPRLTLDVDIVLDLGSGDVARFHAAFPLNDFTARPWRFFRSRPGALVAATST